jgi:hypothetical protein
MMLTLASYENHKSGTGGIATYFGMLRSGSPGEELIADEAPAHILPDDNEHLADLVGACGAPEVFGGEMSETCEFASLDEANEILGLMFYR